MKKRVLAMVLSLTMCMTGTSFVSAADFSTDTSAEQTVEAAKDTEVSSSETGEAGETQTENAAAEAEITPEQTETEAGGETETVTDSNSDGSAAGFTDASNDTASLPTEEVSAETVNYEKENTLYYTRWEYVEIEGAGYWKLQKYSDPSKEQTAEETQKEPEYYTLEDGLVTIDTIYTDGTVLVSGTYLFDENGYMITGSYELDGENYDFTTAEDVEDAEQPETLQKIFGDLESVTVSETASEAEVTAAVNTYTALSTRVPVLLTVGTRKVHTPNSWEWNGTKFTYYNEKGNKANLEDYYVVNPYGDNAYFCLRSDGTPFVGERNGITINGVKGNYTFRDTYTNASGQSIPGKVTRNRWVKYVTSTKKGNHYGWYYKYYNSNGCRESKKSGIYKAENNSTWYILYDDGFPVRNLMFTASNGGTYLGDANGVIYRNQLVKYGNYTYYFLDGGRLAGSWKNCWQKIGNDYYYFGSTGGRVEIKKGIQKVVVNGQYLGYYYFNYTTGKMARSAWQRGQRYFLSDGRMASGMTKVDGKWYYFEPSTSTSCKGIKYTNTLFTLANTFYATSDGTMLEKGWQYVNGYWYYFENFKAVRNTRVKHGSTWGKTDNYGRFCTGWQIMNDSQNRMAYMNPSTGYFARNQVLKIDGKYYRFDSNGSRVNDRTSEYPRSKNNYYLECDLTNGVMTVYANSSKTIPIKTIRVSVGLPATPTTQGTFTLHRAGRWQALMGPSWGQYGTHVVGGIYVHSVACTNANSYNLPAAEYDKLGNPASHGCIRCCVADAKWVWDNCNGCTIRIFKGTYVAQETKKGPLGRNPLKMRYGSGNFDPTDPAVVG